MRFSRVERLRYASLVILRRISQFMAVLALTIFSSAVISLDTSNVYLINGLRVDFPAKTL